MRDELLSVELFCSLAEARVMVEDFREDYNEHRPHSALGMAAPARFAHAWKVQEGPHYLSREQQPPTLTAGGPMDGVRSRGRASVLTH